MRVRAIAQGYYGGFREVGAEFDIADSQPAAWWWVPANMPASAVEPAPVADIPKTLSELSKQNKRGKVGGQAVE